MAEEITFQSVKRKWEVFCALPFPDADKFAARECGEMEDDLFVLDSDLAGCIDTFMRRHGNLDSERQDILVSGGEYLASKLHLLSAGPWSEYFSLLESIVQDILLLLKSRP